MWALSNTELGVRSGCAKCGNCARLGEDCSLPTPGPPSLDDEEDPIAYVEERRKRQLARLSESKQYLDEGDEDPIAYVEERRRLQLARFLKYKQSSDDGDEEPILHSKERRKHEPARFLNSQQTLNDDSSRPPFLKVPNVFASPETSKTAKHGTQPVHSLAYSLPLSPQSRKCWPERYPQHAAHSQLTDGLSPVTTLQPLQAYGPTPLRTLLAKYYLLDAISQVKVVNINSCFDVVHAEPPIRPLAESIAWLYAKPPKVWLAIRRMIRNLYTDVLHDILNVVSDAKLYTDYVLFHRPARPTLGPIEQKFACPALFDCIRVRQYMLNMLFREIQVFILKLSRPRVESGEESHSDAGSLLNSQHPAKSVPVERGRTQATLNSKRWLQIVSQRMWDRILHPTVQGKPCNRAVNALRLTRRSKINCDDIQQTL